MIKTNIHKSNIIISFNTNFFIKITFLSLLLSSALIIINSIIAKIPVYKKEETASIIVPKVPL